MRKTRQTYPLSNKKDMTDKKYEKDERDVVAKMEIKLGSGSQNEESKYKKSQQIFASLATGCLDVSRK